MSEVKAVLENNVACASGKVIGGYRYSHEAYGEKFYSFQIEVERLSGRADSIPMVISDRLVDVKEDIVGKDIWVKGQFRSYNDTSSGRTKVRLFLFVTEIEFWEDYSCTNDNHVELLGHLCKVPNFRKTPNGRCLTEMMLAVHRQGVKSDYIPVIAWGRVAKYVAKLEVGAVVFVEGRMQSRPYFKKFEDGTSEPRVAYEVSALSVRFEEESEGF